MVHLGVDLIVDGVLHSRPSLDALEYGSMLMVATVVAVWGFVPGIAAGVVSACATFVVQSSRENNVRAVFSGENARSNTSWPSRLRARLESGLSARSAKVIVIQLQGHLFFGNIQKVVATVVSTLRQDPNSNDTPADELQFYNSNHNSDRNTYIYASSTRALNSYGAPAVQPSKYLVLDCSFVTGADVNAVAALLKMKQKICSDCDDTPTCFVVFAGLQPALQNMFEIQRDLQSRRDRRKGEWELEGGEELAAEETKDGFVERSPDSMCLDAALAADPELAMTECDRSGQRANQESAPLSQAMLSQKTFFNDVNSSLEAFEEVIIDSASSPRPDDIRSHLFSKRRHFGSMSEHLLKELTREEMVDGQTSPCALKDRNRLFSFSSFADISATLLSSSTVTHNLPLMENIEKTDDSTIEPLQLPAQLDLPPQEPLFSLEGDNTSSGDWAVTNASALMAGSALSRETPYRSQRSAAVSKEIGTVTAISQPDIEAVLEPPKIDVPSPYTPHKASSVLISSQWFQCVSFPDDENRRAMKMKITNMIFDLGSQWVKADSPALKRLARRLMKEIIEVKRGDVLWEPNSEATQMALLLTGRLKAAIKTNDKYSTLQSILPGIFVGELGLLSRAKHSRRIIAAEPSLVALLSRDALDEIEEVDKPLLCVLQHLALRTSALRSHELMLFNAGSLGI